MSDNPLDSAIVAAPPVDTPFFSYNKIATAISDVSTKLEVIDDNLSEQSQLLRKKTKAWAQPWHNERDIYFWWGCTDSFNNTLSSFSLYFSFLDAYRHASNVLNPADFQISLQEFHEAEKTPEGFAIAMLLIVVSVGFSGYGTFYKADDPTLAWWQRWMAVLAPYWRDLLKMMKWWFKGLRALFVLIAQFAGCEQALINLLFPLGLAIGIVASANKMFLRWMRDARKELMKINMDLTTAIIARKSAICKLEEMPVSFQGYENSVIWIEKKEKETIEEKIVEKIVSRSLAFIDANGSSQPLLVDFWNEEAWKTFENKLEYFESEIIHDRMKHYLQFQLTQVNSQQATIQSAPSLPPVVQARLHIINENIPADLYTNRTYRDAYIYFSQVDGIDDDKRLCYMDVHGRLTFAVKDPALVPGTTEMMLSTKAAVQFHKKYQLTLENKSLLCLSSQQVNRAYIETQQSLQLPVVITELGLADFGNDYKNFMAYRKNIIATAVQSQNETQAVFSFFAAGASAIFEMFYFYVSSFVTVLSLLSPPMVLWMLGAVVVLSLICVITRVAEEGDFQRRMMITKIRPELELSRSASMRLGKQLEILLDTPNAMCEEELASLIRTMEEVVSERKRKNPGETGPAGPIPNNDKDRAVELMRFELAAELKDAKDLQDKLQQALTGGYWAAALEGLKNGLAIQGAIASVMFMVTALCYISVSACPPLFILTCMGMGMAALVVCCVQALISQYLYEKKIKDGENELFAEYTECGFDKRSEAQIVIDRGKLKETMAYIQDKLLDPPVDYVVLEWAEIFRVAAASLTKGNKAGKELFHNLLEGTEFAWALPAFLIGGAISFAVAFVMRTTAKGFVVGRPEGSAAESMLNKPGARTFFDRTSSSNVFCNIPASQSQQFGDGWASPSRGPTPLHG